MKSPLFAAALLAAPFVFVPANAFEPDKAKPAASAKSEDKDAKKEAAAGDKDKVICRYVRLDTSSRRKTKVCRTEEGWRALNNPR